MANNVTFCVFHILDVEQMIALLFKLKKFWKKTILLSGKYIIFIP